MRNILTVFIIACLCVLSAAVVGFKNNNITYTGVKNTVQAPAQKKVNEIIAEKRSSSEFLPVNLFSYNAAGRNDAALNSFVSSASTLTIKKNTASDLRRAAPENIEFVIPVSETETMVLELTKVDILADNYKVIDQQGNTLQYNPGVYYRGIIKGDNNSLASVSITETMVMAVASGAAGNFVLGSVKDGVRYTEDYIFYNDADLLIENKFECGIEDDYNKFTAHKNISSLSSNPVTDNPAARAPVRTHFVADYQMYQDAGQNQQAVVDFVTGAFNQVATIYANEYLPIQMAPTRVYTSADPYRLMNDSEDILLSFGQNTQDNFTGDLAHLLSTRNAGLGGIAWIGVLCMQYSPQEQAGRFAFSNIDPDYQPYPTHSWTVNVIAHEMGHNFGSQHTHACVWPAGPEGEIGSIDSCYFAEGNCFSQRRAAIGTIMSYCHLTVQQGGGVNLALGFGPLPGDTIRIRYNQAACFGPTTNSSETPIAFDLLQNYPNPFNPATNIKFALPVDAVVTLRIYDISGRQVASLLDGKFFTAGVFVQPFNTLNYNLASGIYFYRLDAVDPAKGNQKVFMEVNKMVLVK